MKNFKEINKIININGGFSAILGYIDMFGWGNCRTATANIDVFKENNKYILVCYNTNEEGRVYSPHGEIEYSITPSKIEYYSRTIPYDEKEEYNFNFPPSTPYGWVEKEEIYLVELLKTLQEGIKN